jgi:hypothetical protein
MGKILAFSGVRPNLSTRPIGSTRPGPSIKEKIIHPSSSRPFEPNLFNWSDYPAGIADPDTS